jgi:polyhydroxyalkanoate synthase
MAASSEPFHNHGQQKKPEEFQEDLKKMLLGIQKYQQHPFKPVRPALKEVWRAGEVSLQTFEAALPQAKSAGKDPEILILVPSLINRSYILNLMEGRSMMRWFAERGIIPYLLDWGESCEDDGQADLAQLIAARLSPAIEFIHDRHSAAPHVLGYCMGGTILAAANCNQALPVKSLIFLASPWDFHGGSQTLLARVKFWAPSGFGFLQEGDNLPVNWIQSVFASLDPFSSVKKFSKFGDMDADSDDAKLFIAVEDWLNDGVSLPHGIAMECLRDWFIENKIGNGSWQLDGRTISLSAISAPSLIIASKKDRLVEYDMAVALYEEIPGAALHVPSCGHIGMIAGETAIEQVWKPILDWVSNNHKNA